MILCNTQIIVHVYKLITSGVKVQELVSIKQKYVMVECIVQMDQMKLTVVSLAIIYVALHYISA